MQQTIRTKRLTLRPFSLEDAPRVVGLVGNELIAEMTSNIPYPYTESDAVTWISTHNDSFYQRKAIVYAITQTDTGELIGAVSLPKLCDGFGVLGYWLGVNYWGNGFATEASRALVDYCKRHLGLKRLQVMHYADNYRSKSVINKLGVQYIGNRFSRIKGLERELYVYESEL